jgi:hypothetical protein
MQQDVAPRWAALLTARTLIATPQVEQTRSTTQTAPGMASCAAGLRSWLQAALTWVVGYDPLGQVNNARLDPHGIHLATLQYGLKAWDVLAAHEDVPVVLKVHSACSSYELVHGLKRTAVGCEDGHLLMWSIGHCDGWQLHQAGHEHRLAAMLSGKLLKPEHEATCSSGCSHSRTLVQLTGVACSCALGTWRCEGMAPAESRCMMNTEWFRSADASTAVRSLHVQPCCNSQGKNGFRHNRLAMHSDMQLMV